MQREFEIFVKPSASPIAVKRGFSWPGFFFTWLWAFSRGLWFQGGLLVLVSIAILVLQLTLFTDKPVLSILLGLIIASAAGLRGNSWRSKKLEADGYEFSGLYVARSAASAAASFARGKQSEQSFGKGSAFLSIPRPFQATFAVLWLTWQAAFRFRLFLVIAVLLLAAVIGLPILIETDGTARGFTQILITYTLSVITALLGLSTLWLACGTLARDIEECQLQVVTTKPIARWQVWIGKWLGIVSLNAALLLIAGVSVFLLLQWKATKLAPKEQAALRNEVLVARGSVKEETGEVLKKIETETERRMKEALVRNVVAPEDRLQLRKQIKERLLADLQIVPPGTYRPWKIDLGMARHFLKDRPLYLRVKFNTPNYSPSGTFAAYWQIGVPQKTQVWDNDKRPMSLAPDTFHELEIPPNLFDENGVLTIWFINANQTALLFPLDEGMEVLYRESGFTVNFFRGLGVIFCWMALLAALGLAAASYFSFPVAAFVSLSLLAMSFSSGTLAGAVQEGKITNYNAEHGPTAPTIVDHIVVPIFRAALGVINLAKDFSPIDSLSTGRSITWWQLGRAFSQIVLLLGGIFALIGIIGLSRRELATAQHQT